MLTGPARLLRDNKLAAFLGVLVVVLFMIGRDVFVWILQIQQMFPDSFGAMNAVSGDWYAEEHFVFSTPFYLRFLYGIPFYLIGIAALITALLPFSKLQSVKTVALRVGAVLLVFNAISFLLRWLSNFLLTLLGHDGTVFLSLGFQLFFRIDGIFFTVIMALFFAVLAIALRQNVVSLKRFKAAFLPVLLCSLTLMVALFVLDSFTHHVAVNLWEHTFAWNLLIFLPLFSLTILLFAPVWLMATALNAHMLHEIDEFDDDNTPEQDGSCEGISDEN